MEAGVRIYMDDIYGVCPQLWASGAESP